MCIYVYITHGYVDDPIENAQIEHLNTEKQYKISNLLNLECLKFISTV